MHNKRKVDILSRKRSAPMKLIRHHFRSTKFPSKHTGLDRFLSKISTKYVKRRKNINRNKSKSNSRVNPRQSKKSKVRGR